MRRRERRRPTPKTLAENAHREFELIQKPYSVELLSRSLKKAISEAPVEQHEIN
jgi:hypothetical protein